MKKYLVYTLIAFLPILELKTAAQEFEKYTVEDGLSMNAINNISQDEQGFIYLATLNGLNVFNGNQFKHYNSANSTGMSNDIVDALPINKNIVLIGTVVKGLFLLDKEKDKIVPLITESEAGKIVLPVNSLYLDHEGTVWVGTKNMGLYSFPKDSVNTEILKKPVYCNRYSEFSNFSISAICSYQGNIWVGTEKNGIYHINKTNKSGARVNKVNLRLPSQNVWCIELYNDTLFVGSETGLSVIDLKSGKLEDFLQRPKEANHFNNIIRAITRDKNGDIWVGTQEDGIYRMTFLNGKVSIKHYKSQSYDSASLNTNKILSLFADKHDNIWIGTWNGGLNKYSIHAENFRNIRNHQKANILSDNMVKCIAIKNKNSFWLGTYGNGICTYKLNDNSFFETIDVKNNNSVSSLLVDEERNLLIVGTWGNGIKIFDHNSFKLLYSGLTDHPVIKTDRVYSIVKDKHGIFWLGTVNGGVFSLNLKTGKESLKHFEVFSTLVSEPGSKADVRQIVIGSESNTLFILKQDYGLVKAITDGNGTIIETKDEVIDIELMEVLNFSFLKCVHIDKKNNFYIGTDNGILYRESGENTFKNILPNENILAQSIIEDGDNNIWFGTYSDGLIKYSPSENSYKRFLQFPIFGELLYLKESNRIVAATNSGIYELDLSKIEDYPFFPEVVFDHLRINYQNVDPDDIIRNQQILKKHINFTEQLTLGYHFNTFSVSISALSFFFPHENKILYRLQGSEEIWHEYVAAQTNATYSNLPQGDYTLEVKVANIDDVWNPSIRKLKITVMPPWWKTNWAFFSYVLFLFALIYFILRNVKQKAEKIHKQKIEKITKEKDKLLNEQKMRFFTNISHDIRTPLTLILGPLDDILSREEPGTWLNKQHRVIQKNADMLLRLVNQILDFRKIENQKLKLSPSKTDLCILVRNLFIQFESLAALQNIDLILSSIHEKLEIWADSEQLEKVIMNLLSNAMKHINNGDFIEIELYRKNDRVFIQIKDNGPGIDPKDLPNIFDRFYQSNYSKAGGTGIGLALTQKIIELHNGTISAESVLDEGATFTIELPEGRENFNKTEEQTAILDTPAIREFQIPDVENDTELKTERRGDDVKTKTTVSEVLLVIDDNEDIREYLKDNLVDNYKVFLAKNGAEGISKAKQILPSLIICDIMMDDIEGTQVCENLKNDINTSHIPIILLTSKTSEESTIEGFEKGADDYINKPFNIKLLKTRIHNLIAQRNQLREKYSLLEIGELSNPGVIDDEFLTKVIKYIEENISSKELSVEDIAKAVGLTHDQYYRKIRNITGLSANKLTRKIKLKKAANLLKSGQYNVSEVLYMVGFSSPSYFTRCFKEEFGKSPVEFR